MQRHECMASDTLITASESASQTHTCITDQSHMFVRRPLKMSAEPSGYTHLQTYCHHQHNSASLISLSRLCHHFFISKICIFIFDIKYMQIGILFTNNQLVSCMCHLFLLAYQGGGINVMYLLSACFNW